MNPRLPILAGVLTEALLWLTAAATLTRRSTTMTAWLTHETPIRGYLYPLRAMAAVALTGAATAIIGTLTAVHTLT